VARVVQQTVATCGRIDILVNAVGGSAIIPNSGATVDVLTLDEWQRLLIFNLNGTFLFCNAVVPIMKRQRSGKIINISSIAGRGLSQSSSSAYATAKGGIIVFTQKLSFELGPYGINCAHTTPAHCPTRGSSPCDLLSGVCRCRFRYWSNHRRHRRPVKSCAGCSPASSLAASVLGECSRHCSVATKRYAAHRTYGEKDGLRHLP
jgi:NAD(P)-dependent dehydrogenase (short-subunit alcohol dehydrogenase family)